MVGLSKLRPLAVIKVLLVIAVVGATVAMQPARPARAECVFPFTPTTYEGPRDRQLFLNTIELAAFNLLFPGDVYFGLPDIEIGLRDARKAEPGWVPPVLLKAIAYIESGIAQGSGSTAWASIGPSLVAFDCGHGIAQVTTGMTLPDGELGRGSHEQALVATHFAYNIARGAAILVEKWNEAPEEKPIVGTNTGGFPGLLENWYYAIWSYNGFTGPGANRSNHPMDPVFGAWPRAPYSCGPTEDGLGHNRTAYPYQELVLGCAANPPLIDDAPLWQAQPVTLPDLNDSTIGSALRLENFVFPYSGMDIPSPQPFNLDQTPRPPAELRESIIGSPIIAVSAPAIELTNDDITQEVDIFNTGTGVISWYAFSSASWLKVEPYTGVAAGLDVVCDADDLCDRAGHMTVTVDRTALPAGVTSAAILLQALGTPQHLIINVDVSGVTPGAAAD